MRSEELKPCPFCGRMPEANRRHTSIWCANLECPFNRVAVFPADWNIRPVEDTLRAELAAKDAEIERLRKVEAAAQLFYDAWADGEDGYMMSIPIANDLINALRSGREG